MTSVLIFIDWFWPGYKAGGPVRSLLNLTEQLSNEYAFHIVTRNTDYMSSKPYANVRANEWNEIRKNIHVYYISRDHLCRKTILSFIRGSYDKIYINGIYSFYFSIVPVYYSRIYRKKHMVAPRGMLSDQTFSAKKWLKKLFFVFCRLTRLYRKAEFHATMERESRDIQKNLGIPEKNIFLAPNLPRKHLPGKLPGREKIPGNLRLVSIARISPEKNTGYAIDILRHVNKGEVIFDIFGEIYNQEYWKSCKHLIQDLPGNIKATHKGSIHADNIPELLMDYHFMLMPTQGENFGHSILESLMAGCPVIISDKTPWRDLAADNAGWDIPLEQKARFGSVVKHCLDMDHEKYVKWSAGALDKARKFFSNKQLLIDSKKLFQ